MVVFLFSVECDRFGLNKMLGLEIQVHVCACRCTSEKWPQCDPERICENCEGREKERQREIDTEHS